MRKWVGMSVSVGRLECPSGIVILTDGYRPSGVVRRSNLSGRLRPESGGSAQQLIHRLRKREVLALGILLSTSNKTRSPDKWARFGWLRGAP